MSLLDDDNINWVQDLENAVLEECSASDIFCICKGKPLPERLRSEVWQICLDVSDKGNQIELFNEIYDLPNQAVLHEDCTNFVATLGNDDNEKPSITSELESILTYYCKSRNLTYKHDNGWIELLLPLITLREDKSTMYNLFEGIRDTYIPQGSQKDGNAFHIMRLLLQYHDPELCSFLDTKKITPELYCLTWFQSLFAATCNLTATITMWDYYFQQSDPFFIFFLSLIMVINAREQIMSMKEEGKDKLINILSGMPSGLEAEDVADFCSLAQYYCLKTPTSFRTELMQPLYGGSNAGAQSVSQALCLPVSVDELVGNAFNRAMGGGQDGVRFFLVDCRPIEQYNSGHLPTAFHLDCNLMLQEPSAFQTAVQGLLMSQRQALAINSNAAGEHLCFLGSGRNEEDQYTNMVVASFLQKNTKYVSLLTGGFTALHDAFDYERCLQDHNAYQCIVCLPRLGISKTPTQSGKQSSDIFGKISAAMKSKSAEVKGMLFEYIVNPNNSPVQERHVSSNDKQGKRYRNVAPVFSIDDHDDSITTDANLEEDDDKELVSIQSWIKDPDVIEHFPCQEVQVSGCMYKSHLLVTSSHLVVIREVADKSDTGEVIVKRPLSTIVKITAKKRVPDLITFKYGIPDGDSLLISDMDRFLIPNATKATKTVSDQILKTMKSKD
ncbi:TBC1 domain family member 23 isoform X2 [Atheta coriaria]|uniref:TBC1 domain family member 23 isoform X2 n=1 Tax=Dalotia coriaria TaxID=877792 RepID=UPI0031F392F6